jgi:hypothetical protein
MVASVELISDVERAVIDVRVRGRWGRRLRMDLSEGIKKSLARAPYAVLIDLRFLDDDEGLCIPTLLAAFHAATSATPPVRFVLCTGSGLLAHRIKSVGLAESVPTFPVLHQATSLLRRGVVMPTLRLDNLSPTHTSAALARDLVGRACSDWDLGHLLYPCRTVMSELAVNAAEHAGTAFTVLLSLRGPLLHLSVRDGDPTLPCLREEEPPDPRAPLAGRGRGLRLVAERADSWGSMRCQVGKVVWATFRTQPPATIPPRFPDRAGIPPRPVHG